MRKTIENELIGAMLSGQKGITIQNIDVSWKPLSKNLSRKQKEQIAKATSILNANAIIEHLKQFDEAFIKLARSVYIKNDERAIIKKAINLLLKSEIIEEKSYKQYRGVNWKRKFIINCKKID